VACAPRARRRAARARAEVPRFCARRAHAGTTGRPTADDERLATARSIAGLLGKVYALAGFSGFYAFYADRLRMTRIVASFHQAVFRGHSSCQVDSGEKMREFDFSSNLCAPFFLTFGGNDFDTLQCPLRARGDGRRSPASKAQSAAGDAATARG